MRIYSFNFLRLISSLFFLLVIFAGCATVNRHQKPFPPDYYRAELIQPLPQKEKESFDYIICSGDELSIAILQDVDLMTDAIVRPDGKVNLPLAGEVKAVGKTIAQLEEELTKRYSGYIKSPQILVTIKDFGGTKVILFGEVGNPGVYNPIERVGILEVIAMAGGFTKHAVSSSVIVIRGDLSHPETIRLNLARAIKKADMSQNITVQPNDIIYVPKKFIANLNDFLDEYLGPLLKIKGVQEGF